MPGFGLSLGIAWTMLGIVVVLPLSGLAARAAGIGPARAWTLLTDPRTLSAFRVSFATAALSALAAVPAGLLLAWVLERYRFPGRRVLDAAIDLPFALPTAVAGIALTSLYVPDGWLGAPLARLGVTVAYTPLGIGAAMLFLGLPFVVRTVQPVLAALDPSAEEAALLLGARPGQSFRLVVLPPLRPALAAGAGMAFARALGEYGSVIFIAGNRPGVSEIVPLLIAVRLEQFDYPGAALLGCVMLVLSFALLLAVGSLQGGVLSRAR